MTLSVGVFYNLETMKITREVVVDNPRLLAFAKPERGEGMKKMERTFYHTMKDDEELAAYLGLRK